MFEFEHIPFEWLDDKIGHKKSMEIFKIYCWIKEIIFILAILLHIGIFIYLAWTTNHYLYANLAGSWIGLSLILTGGAINKKRNKGKNK